MREEFTCLIFERYDSQRNIKLLTISFSRACSRSRNIYFVMKWIPTIYYANVQKSALKLKKKKFEY